MVSTGARTPDRWGFNTRRLRHLQFQPHPRRHHICYVSQTVDQCIIKVNFHTQTLGGINYSATNPLCQRYAGYKGGMNADGVGGYADGVALSTGTNGAQFNGVYSITMQHRTGPIHRGRCSSPTTTTG